MIRPITLSIFFITWFPLAIHSQSSTLQEYQYDPLGRLIQVNENAAVKVSYCYDKAGNRKEVARKAVDQEECLTSPSDHQKLPPPENLHVDTHPGAGYILSWTAVEGATYYWLNFEISGYVRVHHPTTSYSTPGNDLDKPPRWIQACNDHGCSLEATF